MKPQVTVSQDVASRPIAYVLDDEGPVGQLVARMLSSMGYVTVTFTEVPKCLQQLKEATEYSKPSLLVLDLALGKHDAVDVFDQLKAVGFKGRLLLMSGMDEATLNDVQKICVSRGLTAFAPLKKPFRIDALKERLKSRTALPESDDTVALKGPTVPLERSLADGTLALWYQRKIDLRSGLACGAEALLYGRHPALGHVPLVDSLPSPDSSLYFPLARTAVRQITADWSRYFANEKLQLRFSVKLPLQVIVSRGFVTLLRESVSSDPKFPGLTLNVTNAHEIRNNPGFWEVAAQLKLHRIHLSIADIGAAYSAVAHNLKFPFREIRLDTDLVSNCLLHETKRSLCQNIVDLAHGAGALACAEGVSSRDQLYALVAMRCDRAQGPLCGKPQPIDAFKASLRGPEGQAVSPAENDDSFSWPSFSAV